MNKGRVLTNQHDQPQSNTHTSNLSSILSSFYITISPWSVCALTCRSAASRCTCTCTPLNDWLQRGDGGGNRKEGAWEKRRWGGHIQRHIHVCLRGREREGEESDGKRENGRQHHPPRLGGKERRGGQTACSTLQQTEVEGKWA